MAAPAAAAVAPVASSIEREGVKMRSGKGACWGLEESRSSSC